MPARAGSRTRAVVLNGAALLLLLFLATGCDSRRFAVVRARAVVGHLSMDECERKLLYPEAPASIICPGTEVTVCWRSILADSATITVAPDPDGDSGVHPPNGILYLTPDRDTTVEIFATAYAVTTKKILVIDRPRPALFDAHWINSCEKITYRLDPAFVDGGVEALDVTALWNPTYSRDGDVGTCTTPPFLEGHHPLVAFFFDVPQPFVREPFNQPIKAIEDWDYVLKAGCPDGLNCNAGAALPFEMTLRCPF